MPIKTKKSFVIENGELIDCPRFISFIYISEEITNISPYVFEKCKNIKDIRVSNKNKYYQSVDGVLYSKDGTTLIYFPRNIKDKNFYVPNGVKTIGAYAFSNCYNLHSIYFSTDVEKIEDSAFFECVNLNMINIPNNVKIIEQYAFTGCKRLKEVYITSHTKIKANAFNFCNKAEFINANIKTNLRSNKNG